MNLSVEFSQRHHLKEWVYKNEHVLVLPHWLKAVLCNHYNSSNTKDMQNISLYIIIDTTQAAKDYLSNNHISYLSLFDLGNSYLLKKKNTENHHYQ